MFHTNVTHNEMLRVITVFLFALGREGYTPAGAEVETRPTFGIPFFVLDEPGTGKTTILRELAFQYGFDHVEEITMTQRSAEDIGGYGIPNRTRDAIVKVPDSCFLRVNEAERALLVFDEFGSVEDDKRAACLRVTSERVAGDIRIRNDVRMIAVGNPESSAANANPLDPASANRYAHVPWVAPSADEFGDWLTAGAGALGRRPVDGAEIERRMVKGWDSAFARASGQVAAYLRRFPAHLHQTPVGHGNDPSQGETDQLRWPSRRMWEMLARALAGAEILRLSNVERDFMVHCFMPSGVAIKLNTFLREADIPVPEHVLDGKVAVEWTARMDRTDAILRSTAAFLVKQRARDGATPSQQLLDRGRTWWALCRSAMEHPHGGRDLVVPAAAMVSRSPQKEGAGLNKDLVPEAEAIAGDLYDVLVARTQAR